LNDKQNYSLAEIQIVTPLIQIYDIYHL